MGTTARSHGRSRQEAFTLNEFSDLDYEFLNSLCGQCEPMKDLSQLEGTLGH
ncbi:MAG: hypothetical protein NW220_02295 [Leptolyngbyaceae cyanobacterium bins.349]|nr:hypothetical protein [Leptolyngbyaceae cyanobacterium bins.349]